MSDVIFNWVPDRGSPLPLYRQLADYNSGKIACGDWAVGDRLPAQRVLAQRLGLNRSTVVQAMEELASFGVLEADYGGGTRVGSNTWSLRMAGGGMDWGRYLHAGPFPANTPTIQTIFRLEFQPGYYRLGSGEPSPQLFPREAIGEALSRAAARAPALGYLPPAGLPELREAVAHRLERRGIRLPPSCVLITSGAIQALQLISASMLKSGSTVFAESPTYLKSLQIFPAAGARLQGLAMDREGLRPGALRAALTPCAARSGLLYTIPTFQNPTGTTMPQSRREELFQLCLERRLPVIEDDAYGELWLDAPPPAPIKALDRTGGILYLGTVSKTLSPGLRLGWLVGPESVVQRLADVKSQTDCGTSSLSQWAFLELLESGAYDAHLAALRAALRARRDAAAALLTRRFASLADYFLPSGGFYIWLRPRPEAATERLFQRALERGLLLHPGTLYGFGRTSALRLSYAYESPERFSRGLGLLADLLEGN